MSGHFSDFPMPSLELVWSNMTFVTAAAGALVIGAAIFFFTRSKPAKSDVIRGVVGKASDFKEGEPRAVKIDGAKNQILVVRHEGQLHAVGNKCPHAGAALSTGVFSCGRVVCPWHGASFDVTTGEIEDSGPCLNQVNAHPSSALECEIPSNSEQVCIAYAGVFQLPRFDVTVEGDDVVVSGSASIIDAKV
jgi:nitrite reductase/ring-hydroxylating ferredoxin subunit